MEDKIDRFGECPNCKTSWKGQDILQHLSKLSCNIGKSYTELVKLASNYGWTPDNKACFSTLISHELEDGRNLLECPKISCQHVFDRYTGEEYMSMHDAIRNKPVYKEPTIHVTKENREQIELEMHKNLQNKILSDNPNL